MYSAQCRNEQHSFIAMLSAVSTEQLALSTHSTENRARLSRSRARILQDPHLSYEHFLGKNMPCGNKKSGNSLPLFCSTLID